MRKDWPVKKHLRNCVSPLGPATRPQSSRRCHCPSTVSADLVDPAPANPLRRAGPGGQQAIEATSHLEDDPRPPTPWLSDRTPESSTQPSTSAVIFRAWSSSSIFLRRWVTGTPPVTHTYIQAIKQPTLGHLTRSVRRRAATSKRANRLVEFCTWQLSDFATRQVVE